MFFFYQKLTAETQALANQTNDIVNVLGAKNLIPYPYYRPSGYTTNGLTVTYDADGILTVNKVAGEAISFFAFANTKDYFLIPNTAYTLSMELENAVNTSVYIKFSNDSFDTAAIRNKATGKYETTFTTPSTFNGSLQLALYYGAIVVETNAKVKVMLRLASIQDDTFEPYAKTNQQLTEDTTGLLDNLEVNGAVNMLPNNAASQTINSVEWTVNSDGTVQAYVPSGTTTSAESNLIIATPDKMNALLSEYGELKIVGCPAGGSDSPGGYGIRCKQGTTYPRDNGDGIILKSSGGTVNIGLSCNVRENTTGPKTLLFKPMIGLVSTPNFDYAHYVPYAKSNRELTKDVADARVLIGSVNQHVSVIADGTKTIQTLMQELHSALSSLVASLNTDETIYILGARSDDGTWFRPSNVELKYSKSSTVGNISMDSFTVTAGENCYHYSLTFSSTLATNTFRQMTVAQSGNTFVNRTSDVPSANSQLLLTYQIYKTIS